MSNENYNKLINNGGIGALNWATTTKTYAEDIATNTKGPVISSIVGVNGKEHNLLPFKGNTRPDPSNYSKPGKPVGADINNVTQEYLGKPLEGTVNIPEIYTRESKSKGLSSKWRIFGPNIQVKSLRGNNGNFNMSDPNIYKTLIPISVGGVSLAKIFNTNKDE
jgi:hypothetical protein